MVKLPDGRLDKSAQALHSLSRYQEEKKAFTRIKLPASHKTRRHGRFVEKREQD